MECYVQYLCFNIFFVLLVAAPTQIPLFATAQQAAAEKNATTPAIPPVPVPALPLYRDIAKIVNTTKGFLDQLRYIRKCYDSSQPDHRIVEKSYALMIYSAANQEFAGNDPLQPVPDEKKK